MYKSNKKEFQPIEFSRRGPKTAEEKRNIKKGLKQFWDKKGRAVMAIGASTVALGGAATLAAKSGKIPMPGKGKVMSNVGSSTKGLTYNQARNAKPRTGDMDAFKGGVDKKVRTIASPADGNLNKNITIKGTSDSNISTVVGKASNRVFNLGKQTRVAFDEGYASGGSKFGTDLAKLTKALVRKVKKGTK